MHYININMYTLYNIQWNITEKLYICRLCFYCHFGRQICDIVDVSNLWMNELNVLWCMLCRPQHKIMNVPDGKHTTCVSDKTEEMTFHLFISSLITFFAALLWSLFVFISIRYYFWWNTCAPRPELPFLSIVKNVFFMHPVDASSSSDYSYYNTFLW